MTENVTMRVLHTMEEFAVVVDLQQKIWGMAKQDTVSPYIMNAMSHNGGSVIAAEINGQMVGFCLGFAGKRDDKMLLWSQHGVVSRSDDSILHALDLIEYAETAAHYEYLNLLADEKSEGLSPRQIRSICEFWNVRQSVF